MTDDPHKLKPHILLKQFEQLSQDWILGVGSKTLMRRYFTAIFECDLQPPRELATLRQTACQIGVATVAQALTHEKSFALGYRESLAKAVPAAPDWQSLVSNPDNAYALLNCLFIATFFKMTNATYTAWETRLAEWLPQTKNISFNENSTCGTLAEKLFDPVWLALYEPDFDTMLWEELDALLNTHPPLVGQAVAAVPQSSATLPTALVES